MQAQQANIKLLIKKIDCDNGIQQIRLRSINTLHTKVTLKVLPIETIHLYSELPGALMKWINSHYQKKSEHLYKVLLILTYFAKNQKGLFILKEYQTLQFLEGLKKYMLKQFSNPEPYIELIDEVVKKLVVISRGEKQNSRQNNENLQQNLTSDDLNLKGSGVNNIALSSKQCDSLKMSHAQKQIQKTFQKAKQLQVITLNFVTRKDCLSQEQEKHIFDLTVQLKYGKKEAQFDTLMEIKRFVTFFSKQWFKCKTDLIQQLCLYIQGEHYPWLTCEILCIIFKGLCDSQKQSNQWEYMIVDCQNCKIVEKTKAVVSLNMKIDNKSIFSSVYSNQILITLAKGIRYQQLPFLALIRSPYTFTHFLQILSRLPKDKLQKPNILSALQYYSGKFKQCNSLLAPYIRQPQKVPSHLSFLKLNRSKFCYDQHQRKYLRGIDFDFKIGQNIHRIAQMVRDFELGLQGINYNPVQIIQKLYVNCFLTIVVAVSKQDPLMSYYPKIKQLILQIAVHPYERVRIQLYNSLLRCITDQGSNPLSDKLQQKGQHIQYVNRKYLRSQLLQQSLYDPSFLNCLFQRSLNQSQTIYCMLQILKTFQSKNSSQQNNLGRYATVFFSLTHYQSLKRSKQNEKIVKQQTFADKISSLASTILSRLPKKFQFKILLMKLFSKDITIRCNMAKQLLSIDKSFKGSSSMDLIQQLVYDTTQNVSKKALKIEQSSLRNFINIAMNPQLDWDIRSQAFQNLMNTIQRAEINQNMVKTLQKFIQGLSPILRDAASNVISQTDKIQQSKNLSLYSICIQLYGLILQKLMAFTKLKQNQYNAQILPLQGASKISQEMLICLLSKMVHSQTIYPNRAIKYILKIIYLSVMQSPFTMSPYRHWVFDIFPHHNIANQMLANQDCNKALHPCSSENQSKCGSQYEKFEQIIEIGLYKNFKAYTQKLIQIAVRKNTGLVDVDFQLIQKQIMDGIATNSRSSGIDSLSLVAYLLQRIDSSTLPKDSKNLTSQLLNSLFVKQNSWSFGFQQDVIRVLRRFNTNGVKSNRQMQSLVNPKGNISAISRLQLLEFLVKSGQMLSIQQVQEWIIKPMSRYRDDELLLAFRILDKACLNSQNSVLGKLSQFCQLSLLNQLIKRIKVSDSSTLKHSAMFLLTKIMKSKDCESFFQGQLSILFGAINDGIFQGTSRQSSLNVYTKQFILGLDCTKRIICKQLSLSKQTQNISNSEVKSILKSGRIITGKLVLLLKQCCTQKVLEKPSNILRASILSFMLHLVVKGASQMFKELDVIDIAVGLLSQLKQPISKQNVLSDKLIRQYLIQVSQVCGFLVRWRIIQPQLSQYLITSTEVIKYLFKLLIFIDSQIIQKQNKHQSKQLQSVLKVSIDKIAQLFLELSKKSTEDLFIMKLSKTLKNNQEIIPQNNIFSFLSKFCDFGGTQYLRMFSWLTVIQWKGRTVLDDSNQNQQDSLGEKLMQTYIQKKAIYIGSSLVAMSLGAKKALIGSEYFIQLVKKAQNFIDLKVVQGMKNKKKKIRDAVSRTIQQEQNQKNNGIRKNGISEVSLQDNSEIKNILLLLCSLFHSQRQKLSTLDSLKVPKPLGKRLFAVIEKLYAYMTNENVQNDENPQEHQRISKYFIKMITNLCQSRQLGQFFSAHISENNSFVLEDVCTNIIKSQLLMNRFQKMERSMQSVGSNRDMKQALQILGLLAKHQTARNMISRMKIIDDLNGRVCRLIEQPRKDAINADSLQQLYWVIQFYVQLSQFKDTNSKIMMDKRILQAFISILTSEKFTFHLLQKETLHLMQNLACFKQSKSIFLSNKQIHKVNLYLLEQSFRNRDSIGGQQQNQVSKSILKMIYNLIYKSSAALKIYKRSQVIQLITSCCQAIRCSDQTDGIFNQLKQCLLQALNQ